MHLHPQKMKALVSGAFGPDIRSAIRGPTPGCGGSSTDPEEAAAASSRPRQALGVLRQAAAPWFGAPQTRSFLVTWPQRCWPSLHLPPLLLQEPSWKAWHRSVPSRSTRATCLPWMDFPNANLEVAGVAAGGAFFPGVANAGSAGVGGNQCASRAR